MSFLLIFSSCPQLITHEFRTSQVLDARQGVLPLRLAIHRVEGGWELLGTAAPICRRIEEASDFRRQDSLIMRSKGEEPNRVYHLDV